MASRPTGDDPQVQHSLLVAPASSAPGRRHDLLACSATSPSRAASDMLLLPLDAHASFAPLLPAPVWPAWATPPQSS
jgi:hypothetical protein